MKSTEFHTYNAMAKEKRGGIEYLSPMMIEWLRLIDDLQLRSIDCHLTALKSLARRGLIAEPANWDTKRKIRITNKGRAHLQFYG